MISAADRRTSVQIKASFRHWPSESRTRTIYTAFGPAVSYQHTPVIVLISIYRLTSLLKVIVCFVAGHCLSLANISLGVGQRRPCWVRPWASGKASYKAAFQWIGPTASTLVGRFFNRCLPM